MVTNLSLNLFSCFVYKVSQYLLNSFTVYKRLVLVISFWFTIISWTQVIHIFSCMHLMRMTNQITIQHVKMMFATFPSPAVDMLTHVRNVVVTTREH